MLKAYQINAERLDKAPGVYVDNKKIASIGLRVKNGCTYHGIAINIALDLKPFAGINPCGYKNMQVTQIKDFYSLINMDDAKKQFIGSFLEVFKDYTSCITCGF
jgi:lipoyl(octanoyl) transferase